MSLSEYHCISQKLNASRIYNFITLIFSFLYSIIRKKANHKGAPYAISVEPTNHCNLKCPQCPTGTGSLTRAKGSMRSGLFENLVNQLHKKLIIINFYLQGEPFLDNDLFEKITYASHYKIFTICSTNGHFLDERNCKSLIQSGLDKLIISLDGTTQEVYEKYRKSGDLEKVIEGVKQLQKLKKQHKSKKPLIELQFLAFRFNEHQIIDFKTLAKKLNVEKYTIKSAQIYDFDTTKDWIPKAAKYSRYQINSDGKITLKNKLPNHCFRMWTSAVIAWDGTVLPCCFDKDAEFSFGNLDKQSFSDIWKSTNYLKFRNLILTNRKSVKICRNCNQKV